MSPVIAVHPRMVAEEIIDLLIGELAADVEVVDTPLIGAKAMRYLRKAETQRYLRDALEDWLEAHQRG